MNYNEYKLFIERKFAFMKTIHFKRTLLLLTLLAVTLSAVTGGTIAWFTDSVTSAGNTIQSGNLDISLEYSKDLSTWADVQDATELFNQNALWEPGHTEYVYLKLTNAGNLAIKYEFSMTAVDTQTGKNVEGNEFKLSDYLSYGLVDVTAPFASRSDARNAVENAQPLTDHAFVGAMTAQNQEKTMALVVFMDESVGNEANNRAEAAPQVALGVKVEATQLSYEGDAFDNLYDEDANPPSAIVSVKPANEALTMKSDDLAITIPADAPAGAYSLRTTRNSIELLCDGEPVETTVIISMEAQPFSNVTLTIGETEISATTGIDATVEFTTNTFGEYTLTSACYVEGLKMDGDAVIGGIFKNVDPTAYVPAEGYLITPYSVDKKARDGMDDKDTYYVVSDVDTTVFIDSNDSGKLYSIISGLQNNEHSTVFIKPGTYNEGTTINVYSSMDIIGLGKPEEIKIVKVQGSFSNRHLFNVNGAVTRDEHIEVTIRNMTLDASVKNLNSAGKLYTTNNGAVQSIRLSKTKCYNLVIEKSSGFAFYVNGKYDTRGAYLYAEDITMATTSVVDTADTYRFYYNNVTYGNGAYTSNTSYIKNVAMDRNDWIWD